MKYFFLPLLLLLCWSCSSDASEATMNTEAEATAELVGSQVKPPARVENNCAGISWSTVATTFGWEGNNESAPSTMSGGRIQGCSYTSPDNEETVTIAITQSDEKTINTKYLETSFANALSSPSGSIKHEEITVGLGDQAIYGSGKTGTKYLYRLRWRVGNEINYFVQVLNSNELDAKAVLPKLKSLAKML